jgi:hypothetical protein
MGILNDALIDAKADLCWNHQQEQLQGKAKIDCICGQLANMIYLTRQNIAEEIERELCDTLNHGNFHEDWTHEVNTSALKLAANIARGQRTDTTHLVEPMPSRESTTTTDVLS